MSSDAFQQVFELAFRSYRSGQLAEAERLCRQILSQEPGNADALHLLGVLAHQVGKNDAAVEFLGRAVRSRPDVPHYHNNLGQTLRALGRLEQAVAEHRAAVRLGPQTAEFHNSLGIALRMRNQLDEALACFQRATELNPTSASAHSNFGATLKALGQTDQAIVHLNRAVELDPNLAEAHFNLGGLLHSQGQFAESVDAYQRGLKLSPKSTQAISGLAEAQLGLANELRDQRRLDEAIDAYRAVIQLKPDLAEAHNNLGNVYKDCGQLDEAIACFRAAMEVHPEVPLPHDNLIYTIYFHPGCDQSAIREEQLRWRQRHAEPLRSLIRPHSNDRDAQRKLKVGFVAPHFRNHCQSFFTIPFFANLDHEQIELVCYSDVRRPDTTTQRIQSYASLWRQTVDVSDQDLAELIRNDQIDILVDLSLHMDGNRLGVFARKPAPVQVTWLGYPAGTALDTIDYRITDPYLDPEGLNDQFYFERSVRLPDSFWCFDPLTDQPAVNELPALKNGQITFGCLNNFCKVNNVGLEMWADVLKAVQGSRLVLLSDPGGHRERTIDALARLGADPSRIEFLDRCPRQQYFELYHRIDIALDTFPYNGHTTSLDSFWMGVPVITLAGQSAVSRAGLSLAANLGLTDILVAKSEDQFVQLAIDLAANLPRLAELRANLRQRMRSSPLMDGPRFARHMQAAFRQMWREYGASGSLG